MAKRSRGFTDEKYQKWIKEGRGSGEFENYKPWLTIQNLSSLGTSTRCRSPKTGRMLQLFSNLEKYYAYALEFSTKVIDIREQYPLLCREETLTIADELGIKHPWDSETQTFTVITTDFLVIVREGDKIVKKARTIKPARQLSKRNIEKFEIERQYWAKRNVEWKIVTDKDINVDYGMNLELLRDFNKIENMVGLEGVSLQNIESLKKVMIKTLASDLNSPIRSLLLDFDNRMYLEEGTSISIFNHLIYTKKVDINLSKRLSIEKSLNDIVLKSKLKVEERIEWTYA